MDMQINYLYRDQLIGPHQIAFDITNKCNLRCLHCFNSSGENHVLDDELSDNCVRDFIDSVIPLHLYNFCFCGGEPLLRKDLLLHCSKKLRDEGCIVSIVSNGLLATSSTIDELIESGVRNIQFSLDGAKAESHDRLRNQQGAYDKVIEAIKYTSKHDDVQLSIAFTPTTFNCHEFQDVYNFLILVQKESRLKKPIRLRLQPLMPIGRAASNLDGIIPTNIQYRKLIYNIIKLTKGDITVEWGDPIDHLIRYSEKKLSLNMCSIRANGDITVSPYIPLIVGNIRKHTLKEYWENGLNSIWDTEVVRFLATRIKSINDMNKMFIEYPSLYMGNEIFLDLFEKNLNDVSLLDNYKTK